MRQYSGSICVRYDNVQIVFTRSIVNNCSVQLVFHMTLPSACLRICREELNESVLCVSRDLSRSSFVLQTIFRAIQLKKFASRLQSKRNRVNSRFHAVVYESDLESVKNNSKIYEWHIILSPFLLPVFNTCMYTQNNALNFSYSELMGKCVTLKESFACKCYK